MIFFFFFFYPPRCRWIQTKSHDSGGVQQTFDVRGSPEWEQTGGHVSYSGVVVSIVSVKGGGRCNVADGRSDVTSAVLSDRLIGARLCLRWRNDPSVGDFSRCSGSIFDYWTLFFFDNQTNRHHVFAALYVAPECNVVFILEFRTSIQYLEKHWCTILFSTPRGRNRRSCKVTKYEIF